MTTHGAAHLQPAELSIDDGTSELEGSTAIIETAIEAGIEIPVEGALETEPAGVAQSTYAEWVELVGRIRSGVSDGMEELYQLFAKGIRFYRGLCS